MSPLSAPTRPDMGVPSPSRNTLLPPAPNKVHLYLQDSARQEDPQASATHFFSSLATVAVALMVFFYESASYNIIFLGRVLPARGKGMLIAPFLVLFNVVWCLAIWSYLQAHWADPGTVPRRWQEFARSLGDALPVAPARLEYQPGKATWCKKCCFPRPERAHHCHICGICVLRMDHHCPYIFNCVGFNNHKYFLLLVVYTTSACVIVLLTTMPEFFYYTGVVLNMFEDDHLQTSEIWGFLISCILDLFLTLVLAPMVPAHITLACRNQTSIEGNYNNMPNPFDQGDPSANLRQILGTYGPDWFIPVPPSRPVSDGISFAKSDETQADLEASGDDELEDNNKATSSQMKDHAQALLKVNGDPDGQAERVWRQRYGVRRQKASVTNRGALGSPRNAAGPLDAISLWWRSLRE